MSTPFQDFVNVELPKRVYTLDASTSWDAGKVVVTTGQGLGVTAEDFPTPPVTSVNEGGGDVVITPLSIGAEVAGAAATLMSSHIDDTDPHPTYTTEAEAAAAAPVQSVNGGTGVAGAVVVDAATGMSYASSTGVLTLAKNNGQTSDTVTLPKADSRETRRTQVYWCEDFITHYSRIQMFPLTPAGFSTTVIQDETPAGMEDAIGVVNIIPTAATVTTTYSATTGGLGLVVTGKTIDASWSYCQKKATASDLGFTTVIGFGTYSTGTWSLGLPRIGFRNYLNTGVHTWEFTTGTGGGTTISTMTWAASGCAQQTRITLRLLITTSSVQFYINGTLVATHTTNIPTTQLPDQIFALLGQFGFTDTSYGIAIDYIDRLVTLSSPRAI